MTVAYELAIEFDDGYERVAYYRDRADALDVLSMYREEPGARVVDYSLDPVTLDELIEIANGGLC